MATREEIEAAEIRWRKACNDSNEFDGGYPATTQGRLQSLLDRAILAEAYIAMRPDSDDEPDTRTARDKAEAIVSWLGDQKYQDEPLLHAIVCCDYASQQHLIDAVARIIEDGTVYCHGCSVAGGAERAIYHEPPICSGASHAS